VRGRKTALVARSLAAAGAGRLDAVAALDDVGLEGDGARPAVQLEEEAAGVAQDGARLVTAPERRGAGGAVLADRLGAWSASRRARKAID